MNAFWGPEKLNSAAFGELVDKLDASAEVAAIVRALDGMNDIVDVGGGTGFLTEQLARRGARVTVVEPSAEQRAKVPAGIQVRAGRAEALPMGDQLNDAAIATWVLQYCDDPLRAIDELARIARRCVVIVQAAPNNDLVEVYNLEADVAGLPRADHAWLLRNAEARLQAAGFDTRIEHVAIPVRVTDARATAEMLSRLHFADHPKRVQMIEATEPFIRARLEANGALADDGVLLAAYYRRE
jgi:SAM-dependent methyltransferase